MNDFALFFFLFSPFNFCVFFSVYKYGNLHYTIHRFNECSHLFRMHLNFKISFVPQIHCMENSIDISTDCAMCITKYLLFIWEIEFKLGNHAK